jgi:hypothetical protein
LISRAKRDAAWSLVSVLSLAACSSTSGAPVGGGPAPDDASHVVVTAPADASVEEDASVPREAAAPAGDVPAGKAGADAFCTQLCDHERRCAVGQDAAPAGLSNCDASCRTANESPTTNPPTELLRKDYIDALGSCIAASSCADALATSEAQCGQSIAVGRIDAGAMPLSATPAAMTFCHDLETSPCFEHDSGAPDCLSSFAFFSDVTLSAAISCFTDATCSAVVTCNTAAFTQP